MEILFDSVLFVSIIFVLEILSDVFSLLFMHYSAEYRNKKLSAAWYVCGVLFGFWTLIVFLVKRADFPGPDANVCALCGDTLDENTNMCPRCEIPLPEKNIEKKAKQKKYSFGFGIGVIAVYVISVIAGIAFGAMIVSSEFGYSDYPGFEDLPDRIPVAGVFYDKNGIAYENEDDILFYGEDGKVYTYVEEEQEDEDGFVWYDCYYVCDDGSKYFEADCFVTADGWFYCDKAGVLEPYSVDTSIMTEEELDEYYNSLIEADDIEYKYYDYPYVDADGNIYYDAYEASWNEKGELITADNDIY